MFAEFSKHVHSQYEYMSSYELYTTQVENIFEKYLAAFPEGSNPMYRTRTVHDCAACKQFIRRLGNVVKLQAGEQVTVWDNYESIPHPFKEVAIKMSELVKAAPITGIFRSKEKQYGHLFNFDPATKERHDHFCGVIASRHFSTTPDAIIGQKNTNFGVFYRGLTELRIPDFDDVLELINENALYKGAEFKDSVVQFRKFLVDFHLLNGQQKLNFVWANVDNKYAQFRNTAIGSLLVELAEGKNFEGAVKSYEAKVAPENYKRTTAVISQSQVEAAIQKLTDLGLGGDIYRRYAKMSDVSVNDVLFVDNESRMKMKDGADIWALLENSVDKTAKIDITKSVPMSADKFLADVLPQAKSLEVFVQNRHLTNFISLTAPNREDSTGGSNLFKWNNPFAWGYVNDVTDSMKRRVAELGGRVDGAFRFTHSWNHEEWGRNESLMDLHVFFPGHKTPADGKHDNYGASTNRIGWNLRKDHRTGGAQDVDHVYAAKPGEVPIENISFPSVDRMPEGRYILKIHNWAKRGITKSGFKAEIEAGGQLFQFEHPKPLENKEWVTVATVDLKNGQFTINPVLPTGTSTKEMWGVKTETLVPVSAVMLSPNHWGDEKTGAKHVIFALKNCINPEAMRGIFNEHLRGDLEPHRKVFEVLGAKTKCKPTEDQISGVGFTAARDQTVTVVVDGRRSYTLSF